jgi:riboflavin kinase/FMN adenylyltransferase
MLPVSCLLAIGVFDGVHLGHQAILREMVAEGRGRTLSTAAVTFEPHPLDVVSQGGGPPRLTSLQAKCRLLSALGVDRLAVVPFDRGLASLPPEVFVSDHLLARCRPERVFVGFNFTFGRAGAGTAETLRELGSKHGFGVRVVSPVVVDGRTVSSTLIRELLAQGEVEAAGRLLGRPHAVPGEVIRGDGLGRVLGYPTANVEPQSGLVVPGAGVYAGLVVVSESTRPAVINVGVRPTLGGGVRRVEAHLLDYDGRLYGSAVEILFVARLRSEVAFPDLSALQRQIGADVAQARRIMQQLG